MRTEEWIKQFLPSGEEPSERSEPVPPDEPDPTDADEHEADVDEDDAEVADPFGDGDDAQIDDVPDAAKEEVRELANATKALEGSGDSEADGLPDPELDGSEGVPAEEPGGEASENVSEAPRSLAAFDAVVRAKELKQFLAQIASLTDEAKVVASRDGWTAKVVDPAHVAMVEVTLPAAAFDAFTTSWTANPPVDGSDRPEVVEFGLDAEKLSEALKRAKDGSVRIAYADIDGNGRLEVEIGFAHRSMPAIDIEAMSDPKVPALNLPTEFQLPAKLLVDVVKAARAISDHLSLKVDYDEHRRLRLVAEAQGDQDSYREVFQDEVDWVRDDGEPHRSLFPLDYLDAFLKTVKGEALTVRMGTDYPLRLDWDGPTKGTYLLAPRIESDA